MNCIFCSIAAGDIKAQVIARNEFAMAFHDLNPQAPTHVLVIPLQHFADASEAAGQSGAALLGEIMRMGVAVATQLGLSADGYRFVMNTGSHGGQSVAHLHLHVLGGRQMHWPPG